jgi:hypothetical protein
VTAAPALAPLVLDIRLAAVEDLSFVQKCWREEHKLSPHGAGMAWSAYHRLYTPIINELIARDDTQILCAYGEHDGRRDAILGWLAFTPGKLPAVHFAYTRGSLRQGGIFTRLLDAAGVGKRFLYTFAGKLPAYHKRNAPSRDKVVSAALVKRGVYPTFVEANEWLEGVR